MTDSTKTIYMRKWREQNPDHYREYQKQYKRKMRAKLKAQNEK
jgi:hypothetical protein